MTGGTIHWWQQAAEEEPEGEELEQLSELLFWRRGRLAGPVDRRRLSGAAVRRLSGPVDFPHM